MDIVGLVGKRVAITAAATGIGHAIACALSRSGCKLAICDIDGESLNAAASNLAETTAIVADIANPADVDAFFERIDTTLGGLDALVNNAGIAGPTARVEEVSLADWQRCLDVGLTGHFLCTRAAVPMLKASGGGAIINMSSVVGKLGFALRIPYSAVKSGVIGMTQCLAKELGPHNIRVNAILPGIVEGNRIRNVIQARADALSVSYDEVKDSLLASVSLRRMVHSEDVASMTAFLISDVGKNISGQSIAVDANVESI